MPSKLRYDTSRREVIIDDLPAILVDLSSGDVCYADGSHEALKDVRLSDIARIARHICQTTRCVSENNDASEIPTYFYMVLSYTNKNYFADEIRDARPFAEQVALLFSLDGRVEVHSFVINPGAELEWASMRELLAVWGARRRCSLESFELSRPGLPHSWTAEFTYPYRGKTVTDASQFGQDVRALVSAYVSRDFDREQLISVIKAGQASIIIGLPEDSLLEAKRALWLGDESAEFEVCKDVAAPANSKSGGLIVYGAETRSMHGRDVIRTLHPFEYAQAQRKVRRLLRNKIYPDIDGVRVEAIPITFESDEGLLLIDVPPQPPEARPFIVQGVNIDGRIRNSFFSIPERRGEDTFYASLAAVHTTIIAGRAFLRGDRGVQPLDQP